MHFVTHESVVKVTTDKDRQENFDFRSEGSTPTIPGSVRPVEIISYREFNNLIITLCLTVFFTAFPVVVLRFDLNPESAVAA